VYSQGGGVRRLWFVLALASLFGYAQQHQAAPPTKRATLQEQKACAAAAAKYIEKMRGVYGELGDKVYPSWNHYSPVTRVCAVMYSVVGIASASSYVANAIESRVVGVYEQNSNNSVKSCSVRVPNGKTQGCKTLSEFDDLAKVYFEEAY
jgi:hypothetical protein